VSGSRLAVAGLLGYGSVESSEKEGGVGVGNVMDLRAAGRLKARRVEEAACTAASTTVSSGYFRRRWMKLRMKSNIMQMLKMTIRAIP
jgi:hypothetical protein